MQKEIYSQPTCKMLVVRFEQSILKLSDQVNGKNHTEYIIGGNDDDYETL